MRLPSDNGFCLEDMELDSASTRHGPIEVKAAARGGLWRWWPVGVLLIFVVLGGVLWTRRPGERLG